MAELRATYSVLLDRKCPQQWVGDLCEFASLWAVVVLVVKPREPTGLLRRPHGFTKLPRLSHIASSHSDHRRKPHHKVAQLASNHACNQPRYPARQLEGAERATTRAQL